MIPKTPYHILYIKVLRKSDTSPHMPRFLTNQLRCRKLKKCLESKKIVIHSIFTSHTLVVYQKYTLQNTNKKMKLTVYTVLACIAMALTVTAVTMDHEITAAPPPNDAEPSSDAITSYSTVSFCLTAAFKELRYLTLNLFQKFRLDSVRGN